MKITCISGSPTAGGNNEKLLDIMLRIIKERGFDSDKILLSHLNIGPCTDCGVCKKKKECPIEDDFNDGGQEFTIQTIHSWMHIHGMLVVGDAAHFGGIALKPVESDDAGLKTVQDTVNMVCDTLSRFK